MNAVLIAVLIMLGLSLARVHVVLSLMIASIIGGLLAGLGLDTTLTAFQDGIKNGAQIALSYALLGAFAVAIAHSGLPKLLSNKVIQSVQTSNGAKIKWVLFASLVMMSCFSQNLIPIHIAFIPLIIPPLLSVFNKMQVDRRLLTCLITFGLVNTYMFIPYGFGDIYLNQIMLKNVSEAGLDTSNISVMKAMAIPACGMVLGLLVAVFISYRKPRVYQDIAVEQNQAEEQTVSTTKAMVALLAVIIAFVVQLTTDSLLLGSLFGFGGVFNDGVKMMAMIGFIMITAQGFAEVMKTTEQIKPLVESTATLFAGNQGMASFVMLLIGLIVTMGIGSSFSTIPIISAIYVPLCATLGFSPLATVAIIGTSGALGDAGSPASDSTLGPTSGLAIDGQHDHIKDSVIPTFIHYNIPLLMFGWIASMVL